MHSWVRGADGSGFGLENLPFGAVSRPGEDAHPAVRIGDHALLLAPLARGWERFGEDSRYRRFMGAKRRLSTRELAFFTELDHVDHEAIGALDPETGEGLGVARYMRDAGRPHAAEAAVSVIDAMQGLGLGRILLTRLTYRAAQNGIRCFTASLLTTNHSMLRLFEKLGHVRVTARNGAQTEIDVELPLSDSPTLELMLRSAATGHIARRP